MANITLYSQNGPLTNSQIDANFNNLNTDKAERSEVAILESNGYINSKYLPRSLTPLQAIENVSGTTGLIAPNSVEHVFTQYMSREYELFIPATLTKEIQIFRDGNFGAYITTDKKFRVNYGGSYQTIERIDVSNDWVDVQFAYSDNGTSAVTFDVNVNGLTFGTQQVVTYSDVYIRSIFASEYGFLHVASMGYGTLTNAGVNKMNNYGDACGSLPAVAGNAVTFAQATGTARPLIGRVSEGGRRNLFTHTEDLSNAVWTKTSAVVSQTKTVNRLTLNKLVASSGATGVIQRTLGTFAAGVWVVSFYAEAAEFSVIRWRYSNSQEWLVEFNLATETITNVTGTPTATSLVEVSPGLYRCSVTVTTNASRLFDDRIQTAASVGDGVSGIWVGGRQIEAASLTNYQRVGTTARDVTESGIADQDYLFFDRNDDVLSATISAITGGEIIIAGRLGIHRASLTVGAGTFAIGPTTYTSGPAGVLAAVGDVVGWAVKETPFTTPQTDALIALYQSRGAGALIP